MQKQVIRVIELKVKNPSSPIASIIRMRKLYRGKYY